MERPKIGTRDWMVNCEKKGKKDRKGELRGKEGEVKRGKLKRIRC